MRHPSVLACFFLIAAGGASGATTAFGPVQSGQTGSGIGWTARSLIVGSAATATASGGGDPQYFPTMPLHSGVARLSASIPGFGTGACSGALLADRLHIVTAAHCVSRGGQAASTATVRFYGGSNPDMLVSTLSGSSATHAVLTASSVFIHPDYTGEVVDQNDIALLRLGSAAPGWITAYDIAFSPALALQGFTVAGYGLRSSGGGSVGADLPAGRLRAGENRFELRMGDPTLGGFFDGRYGSAPVAHSWLADFDSGLAGHDAACRLASLCDPGVGRREVGAAPGDSGGPAFIDNRLAALVSYGLSFGTARGDQDATLNSSFGEFNGYVPLYLHRAFLADVTGIAAFGAVPEPGSWAMLIAGFGAVGVSLRRQRRVAGRA